MRDLLGRVARAEGALGAACLAGLLACGLILIAALTLEDSQVDHRSEAIEIRTLVASGRELGREPRWPRHVSESGSSPPLGGEVG